MALVGMLLCALFSFSLQAKTVEGVDFSEAIDLGGQKLVLNGVGVRVFNHAKAYVAGLYLVSPQHDAGEIITNRQPKILRLVFLKNVDAAGLRKGWSDGFARNCKDDCDKTKTNLKMFNDMMVDVKDRQSLRLSFDEDGINISFEGKEPHSGHITSVAFRQSLMGVFIGEHPPTAELKVGLLGN